MCFKSRESAGQQEVAMTFSYKAFCPTVRQVLRQKDPVPLSNWVTHKHYFEMLQTSVIKKLNELTQDWIRQGDNFDELQAFLDQILLRRYLLGYRFQEFFDFIRHRDDITVPESLCEGLDNLENQRPPHQYQKKLIELLSNIQCNSQPLLGLKEDIRTRFINDRPFVHVAVTTNIDETDKSLIRPGITFQMASRGRRVNSKDQIFLSAQGIDTKFMQTVEEVYSAMGLTQDRNAYWHELELFQELVKNRETSLDGNSAAGTIAWLISLIENEATFDTSLVSVWGLVSVWATYDTYRERFIPVGGLKEKLNACKEDGVRIIVVPQATLEKEIDERTTFDRYAQNQEMCIIPIPDEVRIHALYDTILEKCEELCRTDDLPPTSREAKTESKPQQNTSSDETETQGELIARKAAIIRKYLTVAPLDVPDDASDELHQIVAAFSGKIISNDTLKSFKAELSRYTHDVRQRKKEMDELEASVKKLESERKTLQAYLDLLNALVTHTP
jgi:hypothetical protein